jgi:hypothetical protein
MQILALEVNDRVAEAYNRATVDQKKEMNKLIEALFNKGRQKKQSDRLKEDSYYDDFSIKPNFKNERVLKVKTLKVDRSLPKIFID